MIILPHPQGSDEWLRARLGIPTASQFGRIVCNDRIEPMITVMSVINGGHALSREVADGSHMEKSVSDAILEKLHGKGLVEKQKSGRHNAWSLTDAGSAVLREPSRLVQISPGALTYAAELIAESVCGSDPVFETHWMRRGKELEPEAVARFAFDHDMDTEVVGFVLRDDERAGASPDRLLPGSGLEVKCPKPATHVQWLLAGGLPDDHKAQVHGGMLICEREEWWFMSYCPGLKPLYVHVRRDGFTDALGTALDRFVDWLDELKEEVLE